MNKTKAIALLNDEGWTKADAKRALELLDFKINPDADELAIRRAASQFAGLQLYERQRLQAAQKGMVTKKNKEIQKYIAQIEELAANGDSNSTEKITELKNKISKLIEANDELKKDNKAMKNIVDQIRFKLTVEIKDILSLKDIRQIKTKLVKLINYISG